MAIELGKDLGISIAPSVIEDNDQVDDFYRTDAAYPESFSPVSKFGKVAVPVELFQSIIESRRFLAAQGFSSFGIKADEFQSMVDKWRRPDTAVTIEWGERLLTEEAALKDVVATIKRSSNGHQA